jgi:hypothetical protein
MTAGTTATEDREGGTAALGENVPALPRGTLSVFKPVEWERDKERLIHENWVVAARARVNGANKLPGAWRQFSVASSGRPVTMTSRPRPARPSN